MGSLYEKNMTVLRGRLPIPAGEIDRSELPAGRRVVTSHRGNIVFQFLKDGVWRSLTSAYDSLREANQQVVPGDIEDAKIIFVLGEAGFYHLESVLEHASERARVMFMSIHPEYLKLIFGSRDLTNLLADERLVIVTSSNIELIKAGARGAVVSDIYDVPTFSLIIHPMEMRLQEDFVYSFQEYLHWLFSISLTTIKTTQYFERWWSHNFVANIPYLLTGTKISQLKGSWANKPVLIVGAGPSLNKNLHLLRRLKGKALIFCVDTAYRILQKAGVEPDLLVTLDGSPMNAEHMAGCDYSTIPMFFDEYSHRDITSNHSGPKIVNSTGMFHEHWWNRVYDGVWTASGVPTGGSVATTAFSIARLIGASPVIMTGVDLSYPQGKLYAEGTLRADATVETERSRRSFVEIEDIFGAKVNTTHDYLFYLRWLEMEAQKADRLYINATEGGALKKGFTLMPLSACIEQYCYEQQPVDLWKQKLVPLSIEGEKFPVVLRNMKRSKRELRAAEHYLRRLTSVGEDYHSLLDKGETDHISELAEQMNRLQTRLVSLPFAMDFLDSHSFQAIYNDIKMTELTDRDRDKLTHREHSVIRAAQMLALFVQLHQIAQSSIEMHTDGIELLTQVMSCREEKN